MKSQLVAGKLACIYFLKISFSISSTSLLFVFIANPCNNKCRNPVHGIKTNCTITGDFPFTGKCHCPAGFEGENCEIRKLLTLKGVLISSRRLFYLTASFVQLAIWYYYRLCPIFFEMVSSYKNRTQSSIYSKYKTSKRCMFKWLWLCNDSWRCFLGWTVFLLWCKI